MNTHPRHVTAPGEQLGVRCLAQGHLSRGIEGGYSPPPPPTIPAGPEIRTHNLPLTSPLSVRPRLPHKIDRCVYHLSIFLLIHLSSIYRSIHWSIYLSYFCLSIYLSVCLKDTKHVYTDISPAAWWESLGVSERDTQHLLGTCAERWVSLLNTLPLQDRNDLLFSCKSSHYQCSSTLMCSSTLHREYDLWPSPLIFSWRV